MLKYSKITMWTTFQCKYLISSCCWSWSCRCWSGCQRKKPVWLSFTSFGKTFIVLHRQIIALFPLWSDFSMKLTDSLDSNLSPESGWDNNHCCFPVVCTFCKTEQITQNSSGLTKLVFRLKIPKVHSYYKQCCVQTSVYQNKVLVSILQLVDRFRDPVFIK